MEDYPRIEEHGAIFNNRTAALISSRGEIDWACFPNFDSDPIFFSILDRKRGGFFKITPLGKFTTKQRYLMDTNILITEFYNDNGLALKITDFLPVSKYSALYCSEVHRFVEIFDKIKVEIRFSPFDRYRPREFEIIQGIGAIVKQDKATMTISTHFPLELSKDELYYIHEGKKGENFWIVACYGLSKPYPLESFKSKEKLNEAIQYWHEWLSKSKYEGVYHELINRSLLVLKGLFFDPNMLMIAAPTTSLPESIGGERNWDYRYCWIRDTAYVIDVLCKLGYFEEAARFLHEIIDRVEKEGRLRSIYSITGKDLEEKTMEWEGYLSSKPVRIGNKAYEQFQLDQYGSLIQSVYVLVSYGEEITLHTWEKIKDIAEMIMKLWKEPDHSIWEIRGEPKHYVYSKAVAWRSLGYVKEMIKMLKLNENDFDEKLEEAMREIRREIEEKGVSKEGYYVQYFGSDYVDASLLRLPLINYCDVKSERFKRTLKEIEKRLMKEDFLFKRYDSDDGLKGEDNAFLLLSFWYIEDLILLGEVERAKEGLFKITKMMNSLNLLPEEIEFKTYRYLGNYPQALSHLALIRAILALESVTS